MLSESGGEGNLFSPRLLGGGDEDPGVPGSHQSGYASCSKSTLVVGGFRRMEDM